MKPGVGRIAASIGGTVALFAPVGRCPICLSAATGVAGSLGLGVLASQTWFLPVIGAFLLLGLWGTITSARIHHRWLGVWATSAGALLLMGGRILVQPFLLWVSAVLLTGGLVFDLYWKRELTAASLVQIGGIQ